MKTKSKDVFRDLCENAHDLIQSVSPEGRFLYVNQAWMRTLGYSEAEVRDLDVFDVIHPDSRDHCREMMRRVVEGEPVRNVQIEFQSKDGRRIPVEGNASCRFDKGKPVATRGIFRNVSERNEAIEELDRLFNMSLDLLCVAGFDGYFKQVNPAFERVLGYTKEELLSKAFVEFVHPDDVDGTVREVERLSEGKPSVDFRNRYRAKDGSWRWLAWRAAPLTTQGLIYAIARDITDQIRIESQMVRQAEDLARSNRDLQQFAYVASHDLQAPLRSIGHLAEWLSQEAGESLPPKAAGRLDQLRERVGRMGDLIDDLLTYARVGQEKIDIAEVDTETMVEDLVFLLSPEGIRVRIEGEMPVCRTAKAPLEQVLRNLIGNAISHHDRDEGEVVVSCRDLGDRYEFAVRDDGPGIPGDHLEEIFEMFRSLQSRDRSGGTGMGLALVQRIVENQGGDVKVESGDGRGSNFRFTWPKQVESES